MKIRKGFVSNSSSSSFILIGKKINVMDITDNDIKEKIYVVIGKGLSDGTDVFYINSVEMLWFVKTAFKVNLRLRDADFDEFEVYETIIPKYTSEDEIKFDSEDLPKGELTAFTFWKDYNSSENIQDLFDKYHYNYDNEAEFDAVYNRFQRKDKLNKIKENETD